MGTAILSSDASGSWKAAAGLLFFPIPEVFDVSAIAILGKPGWEWLKSKLFGVLRRAAPPDQVGPARYRIGLLMFVLPLLMGWLGPYVASTLPLPESREWVVHLASDVMFLASFLVLGGDFWDKLQPALMTVAPNMHMLVAIVEELKEGNLTVFVPMAPTPGLGFLQIVSPSRLEKLECSMSDALGWPLNWGAGTEAILGRTPPKPLF